MIARPLGVLPAVLLTTALLLAGCASGDDTGTGSSDGTTTGTSTASASANESPTSEASGVTVKVAVKNGKVVPATHRVEVPQGEQVRITVTSDVPDEIHVHGYEIERPVKANKPTTIAFTASQTGLFEVETHESQLQLLQLEVR